MNPVYYILGAALAFLIYGMVGADDYDQALASEREYCKRYMSGVHANYRNVRCYERYGD